MEQRIKVSRYFGENQLWRNQLSRQRFKFRHPRLTNQRLTAVLHELGLRLSVEVEDPVTA